MVQLDRHTPLEHEKETKETNDELPQEAEYRCPRHQHRKITTERKHVRKEKHGSKRLNSSA